MGILQGAFLLAVISLATVANAETLYVIEQLVVSVNANADGSGDRVGQVKSGEAVELLDREEDQAHIRLPSGQEGWVRASYLSSSLPLAQQLSARTDEFQRLRKEKTQLEADLAAARRAASAAASAPARVAAPTAAPVPAAVPIFDIGRGRKPHRRIPRMSGKSVRPVAGLPLGLP